MWYNDRRIAQLGGTENEKQDRDRNYWHVDSFSCFVRRMAGNGNGTNCVCSDCCRPEKVLSTEYWCQNWNNHLVLDCHVLGRRLALAKNE